MTPAIPRQITEPDLVCEPVQLTTKRGAVASGPRSTLTGWFAPVGPARQRRRGDLRRARVVVDVRGAPLGGWLRCAECGYSTAVEAVARRACRGDITPWCTMQVKPLRVVDLGRARPRRAHRGFPCNLPRRAGHRSSEVGPARAQRRSHTTHPAAPEQSVCRT